MAKSPWHGLWLIGCLLLSPGASGQTKAIHGGQTHRVKDATGIVVDGDLGEWGKPDFIIDSQDKVWRHGQKDRRVWAGKQDLSAEVYLRYDAAYLFLAGRVVDDHHVEADEGENPETGDAIELFLDVDPNPRGVADVANPKHHLTERDVQLFLLPLAGQGKWIRRPWDSENPGKTLAPTGSELTGMQLVARRDGPHSYTFEARIPFHNFLDVLGEPVGDIGFHLAFDDRDPGSKVTHYMTLNGENPTVDTLSYCRLKFPGRAPLSPEPETGLGLGAELLRLLPWALVGLLLLVTIRVFALRTPMLHLSPMPARLIRVLGIVLLLVGLGLPRWLADNHVSEAKNRLANAVTQLEKDLPQMEEGTLKSYVGEARDEPLLAVLQGKEIQRKQFFSYQFLSEMTSRFGTRSRSYPDESFEVRPYWIPLPDEQPKRFAFKRALDGGRLAIVLSEPVHTDFLTEPSPMTLRLAYRLRDKSEDEAAIELPTPDVKVSASAFGKANREMYLFITEIPGKVEALSLTALGGDQVQLVGLTVVPTDADASVQALSLGQPLGEIESDLRGIYPEDAGFELPPKGKQVVTIPEGRRRTFQKMWFVYRATYPGEVLAPDLSEGDDVCKVTIKLSKGADRVISLEHQRSMFYGLGSRNKDVPEGVPALQVEVGSAGDGEDQDKRINVVYLADLKLPRGVTVQSIQFNNTGPYPIRFRSVIFGSQRRIAPSELADSPLQLADGKAVLKKKHLDQLRGMSFAIYRNGSLAHSNLDQAGRERRAVIPAAVRDQRLTLPGGIYRHEVDEGDTRVFGGFLPLQEDRNVVLGVWAADSGFGDQLRFFSLIGTVISLLSAPFLLLLFNDALGWLSNLRLRLMAVVSVAAMVPLAVLFVFLVRVLEGGHEDELQRSLRQSVRTVSDQLRERQKELLDSARSWVQTLKEYEASFRKKEAPHSLAELKADFEEVMGNQLPPEWKRGFMRLEYRPEDGAPEWLVPFTIEVGDGRLRSSDTALRDEPGVYKSSGEPIIGVRVGFKDDPLALSVARHLGSTFLKDISPGLPVVLCDPVSGYQLAASERAPQLDPEAGEIRLGSLESKLSEEDAELHDILDRGTALMRDRATVPADARETRQPVFRRHRLGGTSWIAAYDVVRNPQGGSGAMLGVLKRDSDATLTLSVGTVPVRTFFIAIAGFLLVLSLGLASIVTSRITDPIELLEEGAEALRRGEFDVRVKSQEGGQIGRLTETFNNMAQELRGRIQDLTHLNRGIQELTSRLDLDQILASAIAFFSRHSPADRVRVLLLDYERDRAEIYGATCTVVDRQAPDIAAILEASGPMSIRFDAEREGTVLAGLFPEHRSVVVMPLVLAGRPRGCVMLLFESAQPIPVNLELLSTIASQTAAAIENARLYRHAVEDLYTGAYVPEYFSRLVRNSVALAQEGRREMALIGLRLTRGNQLEETLGAEGFGRYMERVARCIRTEVSGVAKLCRAANDTFQLLLPEAGPSDARDLCARVERELRAADLDLHGATDLLVASAVYPEDGASAEFLFHALESKLRPDASTEGAVHELLDDTGGLILNSAAMSEVVRVLKKVAPSDLTILLAGETGSGKEVLTNLIHRWSKRARGPLVKVHCAALPSGLLESELFGHEKGAFTGAIHRKIGKFEQADGGTIFLDEIGEMSLETQVKLLRVLQEREVDRVGGMQPVHVDVRVVAATNRNIEEMVADGAFREDLYYRLQGMVLTVPSLRERRAEIPGLVEMFRREAVAAGHTAVHGFSTDAMDELYRKDWPGNIRELRNCVFRAMVLAGDGLLERSHLLGILPRDAVVGSGSNGSAEAVPEDGVTEAGEPTIEIPTPRPRPATPEALPSAGRTPGGGSSDEGAAMTERLTRLLNLIETRGSLSNQEYVQEVGVSPRTGLRDLNDLLERNLIRRVGRRRGARYFVNGAIPVGGE